MSQWKDTDFGRMPYDWELSNLGNICQFLTDGSHLSPKPVVSNFYMASVKDMRYNFFEFNDCKTISKEDFNTLIRNNCSPKYGDILLSKDGANCLDIIFVYKQKNEIVLLSSIAIARLKEGYNPDFYRYFLLSPNVQAMMRNNFISGSAIPRVILKDFKNVPVPLVNYSEQIQIASILSILDEKIDLLHRQNKTLEQLAKILFRQWFVEEADENWEVKTLNDVCITIASGGTPATRRKEYYNGNINWYSTKELQDKFLFESVSKITKEGLGNSSAKLFPPNTIVIAIYAAPTVGRLGILVNEASFNQAACGFIVDENKICFEFLFLFLLMSRQKLNDMASGSAQQNLNIGIMKSFEMILPPKDLMEKFKVQVRPIFEKIKFNSTQIRTLTQLRDTLLPKLMSGEVRVNN